MSGVRSIRHDQNLSMLGNAFSVNGTYILKMEFIIS